MSSTSAEIRALMNEARRTGDCLRCEKKRVVLNDDGNCPDCAELEWQRQQEAKAR